MAELRQFQQQQSQAPRFSAVPAAPAGPSGIEAALSVAQSIIPQGLPQVMASGQQAAASAEMNTALGQLEFGLSEISENSRVDPTINPISAQKAFYNKWAEENIGIASKGAAVFKAATGAVPSGLTPQQEIYQANLNDAREAGVITSDMGPEEQFDAVQNHLAQKRYAQIIQDRQAELNLKKAEGEATDQDMLDALYGDAPKLVELENERLSKKIEKDLEVLKNNPGELDRLLLEWSRDQQQWGMRLNSEFKQFLTDPTLSKMVDPISKMYEIATARLKGDFTTEAAMTFVRNTNAQAAAYVRSNPEDVVLMATSEAFGHSAVMQLAATKTQTSIMKRLKGGISGFPQSQYTATGQIITEMAGSGNDTAVDQARESVVNLSKDVRDNTETYTQDQLLEIADILNQPDLFKKMSDEEQQSYLEAFDKIIVDAAEPMLRDIERDTMVSTPAVFEGPGGFVAPSQDGGSIYDFADLVIDENGIRFDIKTEFRNNRSAQNKRIELNKRLSKLSPLIANIAGATGKTPEEAAAEFLNITQGGYLQAQQAETQPSEASTGFSDWWDRTFVQPTVPAAEGGLAPVRGSLTSLVSNFFDADRARAKAGYDVAEESVAIPEVTVEAETSVPAFDKMFTSLVGREGGFQNDPDDKGNIVNGKVIGTKYGITPRTLADYRRVAASSITEDDMRSLGKDEAKAIYEKSYLTGPRIDELPTNVQTLVFDTGVTSGPSTSIKILQNVAGLPETGVVDDMTVEAANSVDPEVLKDAYRMHYVNVAKAGNNYKFLNGWLNRLDKIETVPIQESEAVAEEEAATEELF